MAVNLREVILGSNDDWDYRTLLISSLSRKGYPSGSPVNMYVDQRFNFIGMERIAVKSFRWTQGYISATPIYSLYVASDTLSYWDAAHYMNSVNLGGNIISAIPIGLAQYSTTGVVYEYSPVNLDWHIFSRENSFQNIDIKLLSVNGQLIVPDPAIPNAMEWDMEILIASKRRK